MSILNDVFLISSFSGERSAECGIGMATKRHQKETKGLPERLMVDGHKKLEMRELAGGLEAQPKPSVVLLDLNLPEIHGFDVLKWIRAHPLHSELPVVVFSSSEREEDRARAKLLGANEFLKKPSSVTGFQGVARRLGESTWGGRTESRVGDGAV